MVISVSSKYCPNRESKKRKQKKMSYLWSTFRLNLKVGWYVWLGTTWVFIWLQGYPFTSGSSCTVRPNILTHIKHVSFDFHLFVISVYFRGFVYGVCIDSNIAIVVCRWWFRQLQYWVMWKLKCVEWSVSACSRRTALGWVARDSYRGLNWSSGTD